MTPPSRRLTSRRERSRLEAPSLLERALEVLAREPVRVRLHTFLVLLAGYLVARGVITESDVAFYTAAGALLLGVPAVESARSHVSPVAPSRS